MIDWLKQKYGKKIIVGIVILILLPIIIWLICLPDSPLSAGIGLKKADWLTFFGSYLAFVGTVVVAVISVAQAGYYKYVEDEKEFKEIQPIIVLEIMSRNVDPSDLEQENPSITFAYNEDDADTNGEDVNHNVLVKIYNASEHVARNIQVFSSLYFPVLEPHKGLYIVFSYDEVEDDDKEEFSSHDVKVYEMNSSETQDGFIPDWIELTYEDELRNVISLGYEMLEFDNGKYYSQEQFKIIKISQKNDDK